MDKLTPEQQKTLDDLIDSLAGANAAVRDDAFIALTGYFSDEAVEYIYHDLIRKGDTQSLYWLVRYLTSVESIDSFEKLWEMLNDDNELVRAQARAGVPKIEEHVRADMMIRLLKSERTDDLIFAAHQLGEMVATRAFYPLLEILENNIHTKVRLEAVRAIELFKNPAALPVLEKVIRDERGELQETAFRVVVNLLLESGKPEWIKRYVASDNSSIRQTAYLAMLRFRGKRWESFIARSLEKEEERSLKIRVLSSVRTIQTRPLFDCIFGMAVHETALTVRMIAQSVLRRIKSGRILGWLLDTARHRSGAEQELSLRLMGEYDFSGPMRTELEKLFEKAPAERVKLIVLSVLGKAKSAQARDYLAGKIRAKDRFSHTAATSWCKIIDPNDWGELLSMMDGPAGEPAVTCVFLTLINHLPRAAQLPDELKEKIRRLIEHPDRCVRYLAVRCLSRTHGSAVIRKLLMLAAVDPDPSVRFSASQSLQEILNEDPLHLMFVASISLTVRELFPVVRDIFRKISVRTKDNFRIILKTVLELIRKTESRGNAGRRFDALRLTLLIRNLAEGEKSIFMELLQSPEWTESERLILLRILSKTTLYEYQALNVDFMAAQYRKTAAELKPAYLKFFAQMTFHSEAIDKVLCESLEWENDETVRGMVQEILSARLAAAGA